MRRRCSSEGYDCDGGNRKTETFASKEAFNIDGFEKNSRKFLEVKFN